MQHVPAAHTGPTHASGCACQVLLAYDAETRVEVGPPGPDNITNTVDRFKALLAAFSDAPWTFQRMCEILLEPKKQYTRLPKVGRGSQRGDSSIWGTGKGGWGLPATGRPRG